MLPFEYDNPTLASLMAKLVIHVEGILKPPSMGMSQRLGGGAGALVCGVGRPCATNGTEDGTVVGFGHIAKGSHRTLK